MLKKLFNSSTFQFLGESLYLLRLGQGIHLSCWKIRLQAFKRYGVRFDGLSLITIHMGHPCLFSGIAHLCEGTCKFVEAIGKGLCNVLDGAVGFLYLTEKATAWVGAAINFLLTAFRVNR